jgi:hypothetical protein
MDLDNANNQLDKVDGLLTTFGKIMKKHWGKLLLIGLGAVVWWFFGQVAEEVENPSEPYYENEYYEESEF